MTINILDYKPLCVKMAGAYYGNGIEKEDLVQEGMVGLCKAVKNYDASRGVPFVAFCKWYVKDAMSKAAFNNFTHVKVAGEGGRHYAKIFSNIHKYRKTGQFLTQEEATLASDELNVPLNVIWDMEKVLVDRTLYLDREVVEGGTGHDLVYTSCLDEQMSEAISDINQEEHLLNMIDQLAPRDKTIIQSRFLQEKPLTRSVVAADLGISQQRVAQLEKDAISTLKEMACA